MAIVYTIIGLAGFTATYLSLIALTSINHRLLMLIALVPALMSQVIAYKINDIRFEKKWSKK